MNFCPNCGSKLTSGNFCSSCGANLTQTTQGNMNNSRNNIAGNLLGTLVTVSLVNGLTKNLYLNNGNYYYDKQCRRPFNSAMILGLANKTPQETATIMSMMGQKINIPTMLHNQMAMSLMKANDSFEKSRDEFEESRRRTSRKHEEFMNEEIKHTCFCDYCHEEIDSDSKFCKYCGKSFED